MTSFQNLVGYKDAEHWSHKLYSWSLAAPDSAFQSLFEGLL